MKIISLCLLTLALYSTKVQCEETSTDPAKAALPSRTSPIDTPIENKKIRAGLSYRSKYYWRGQWFYGASSGVFFPHATYANKSLYLYFGAEIGESLAFGESGTNESGFGEAEKDWQGLDVGAVKTFELSKDLVDLSLGAWYFWYFKSKEIGNDNIDNSFADLRASFIFKSLSLTPTLTYSHYLRSDDKFSERTDEDYYITLAISHAIDLDSKASFTITGDINYWHYASKEESPLYGKKGEIPSGLSDAVLKGVFTWVGGQTTFTASLNYARVFDDKFDYTEGEKFDQNKSWSTFGVERSF